MKPYLMFLALMIYLVPVASYAAATADEQRAAIQKMEQETLQKLYKVQPDTQREIAQSAGYAVFSSGELAIIWISAGYGHGIAHNNANGKDTYMQMAKAGIGLGLGAKDFNAVFVFHEKDAYDRFIVNGLDLTGTADAAVKAGAKGEAIGGAADVIPGVRIYQLTDTGLMAQAMLQGTKYWRDEELNNSNINKIDYNPVTDH